MLKEITKVVIFLISTFSLTSHGMHYAHKAWTQLSKKISSSSALSTFRTKNNLLSANKTIFGLGVMTTGIAAYQLHRAHKKLINQEKFNEDRFNTYKKLGVFYTDTLLFCEPQASKEYILPERLIEEIAMYFQPHEVKAIIKNFKRNYQAPVELIYINSDVGYGIFASEKIKAHTYLGEYTGVVVEEPFGATKPSEIEGYDLSYPEENFNYFNQIYVDAKYFGNWTRFVNHSWHSNVSIFTIKHEGKIRSLFVARTDIEPGQQIFFNYGRGYWLGQNKMPQSIDHITKSNCTNPAIFKNK